MEKLGSIVFGCILIIVGTIVGLNLFEITNINLFFDGWWTLIIIIPSIIVIIKGKNKIDGIIGLVIGLVLLLICQNIVSEETIIKICIPLLIITLGISIITKSISSKKDNNK